MLRRILQCSVISLVTVLAVFALGITPAGKLFSLKGDDIQAKLFASPDRADSRIVMIEVDQASLDYFDADNIPFPWPRSMYNPLIDYCTTGGAKAVVFDILFNNTSPYGEEVDGEFAEAIRRAGNVFLAAAFSAGRKGGIPSPEVRHTVSFSGFPPPAITSGSVSLPLPPLLEAAAGIGSVVHRPDSDGVYRRMKPFILYGGRLFPSLAAAPAEVRGGDVVFTPRGLSFDGGEIPLDSEGRMLIRFHGPRGTYRRLSAAAVISSAIAAGEGRVPAVSSDFFKDAYVLVGYSAPGLFDLKPNPLSPVSPALEINAAAMDNLVNMDFLASMSPTGTAAIAVTAAAATAAAVLSISSSVAAVSVTALVATAVLGLSGFLFSSGLLLDITLVHASILLSLLASSAYKYQIENRLRRFYAGAFSRYVSPKIIDRIVDDPEGLTLGGEKREVTVLFSDLAGFTSISEKYPPRELVTLLNEYTTIMHAAVTRHDGTLDKYIGDAVMAFWGAPLEQENQARDALLAAIDGQREIGSLAKRIAGGGGPLLSMRIGINTGTCIAGNMGSKDLFDYTVIGDAVNLAARLESLNKVYGTATLTAEDTWASAGEAVFGRSLDSVKVKGKERAVQVYEVMCAAGSETDVMSFLKEYYEQALYAYRVRDWHKTIALTDRINDRIDDPPSQVLAFRARGFIDSPPPDDWDGSFVQQSK